MARGWADWDGWRIRSLRSSPTLPMLSTYSVSRGKYCCTRCIRRCSIRITSGIGCWTIALYHTRWVNSSHTIHYIDFRTESQILGSWDTPSYDELASKKTSKSTVKATTSKAVKSPSSSNGSLNSQLSSKASSSNWRRQPLISMFANTTLRKLIN